MLSLKGRIIATLAIMFLKVSELPFELVHRTNSHKNILVSQTLVQVLRIQKGFKAIRVSGIADNTAA